MSVRGVGHWLLASLCSCGSEPKVSQGCQMDFGLLPTFLLDASAACLSLPFLQGVVSIEQTVGWTKACGSSVTSDLCPLPF